MGVYLCVNKESYEFVHGDTIKMNVKEKYNHYVNLWKQDEESRHSISFVLFLGEAKHKIKKKAEQEACRLALLNLK